MDPKLDKPDINASKVAADAENAGPELNHAPGVERPKEISLGERAAEPAEIKLANVSVESFLCMSLFASFLSDHT